MTLQTTKTESHALAPLRRLPNALAKKHTTVGSFIRTAILTLSTPTQPRPTAPIGIGTPPVVNDIDKETFKEEIRVFVKTKASIESTMKSLCDLIWGQCSKQVTMI
jgi:hypothetical protein